MNISKSFTDGEYIFTEHNIVTLEDEKYLNQKVNKKELLKNNSSKSIIYAPFNSSLSNFSENEPYQWPFDVLDLLEPKRSRIIKFSKLCKDLNREYEKNNNADLDNGVYNAFVKE
jgi:hypothetical protein